MQAPKSFEKITLVLANAWNYCSPGPMSFINIHIWKFIQFRVWLKHFHVCWASIVYSHDLRRWTWLWMNTTANLCLKCVRCLHKVMFNDTSHLFCLEILSAGFVKVALREWKKCETHKVCWGYRRNERCVNVDKQWTGLKWPDSPLAFNQLFLFVLKFILYSILNP